MILSLKLFFYRVTALFLSAFGLMPCQISKLPYIDVSTGDISVVEKSGYASRVMALINRRIWARKDYQNQNQS